MPITPILLKGHARNLTCVAFNRDSDLIFTAAKDKSPQVWYTHNGERLGTFEGHQGAVMHLDVSYDSKFLLTASGDKTVRYWQALTGKEICSWEFDSMVRTVVFSEGDEMFLAGIPKSVAGPSSVAIFALEGDDTTVSEPLRQVILPSNASVSAAVWGPLNSNIIVGCDDGCIRVYDIDSEEQISSHQLHKSTITSITYSKDRQMLITSSLDMTARILDAHTLETIKTIQTDRPLNAAVLSPILNHAIVAGGQDALDVMHTSAKHGHFEVEFWHTIYEERLASVTGHFGPVNTLAVAPNGKMFASGGEDGFVRLHHFDKTYLNSTY